MKKYLVLLAMLALSAPAFAQVQVGTNNNANENQQQQQQGQTQTGVVSGTNTSTNTNTLVNSNTFTSGPNVNTAISSSRADADADSHSNSGAFSGGNKQITNINDAAIPDKVKIFQAPGIGLGAAEASAPCRIAVGGGVTLLYGGLLGNGSFNDEECQARENARILSSVGEDVMAVAVLCGQKAISSANPTRCDRVRTVAGVNLLNDKTAAQAYSKQQATKAPAYGRR